VSHIHPRKTWSQHFLQDKNVISKIIEAAQIQPNEFILEIGPGRGILTQALVKKKAQILAVEIDHDLVNQLQKDFPRGIKIIEGDILQIEPPDEPYKVIANVPYHITSKILFHFLRNQHPPTCMVLMVQKEVADRLLAQPPAMSLLSVVGQLYARCKRIINVPASAFYPQPQVDSSVIALQIDPLVTNPEDVIHLAKIGFSSKRRQLQKNLASSSIARADDIKELFIKQGWSPSIRAENLCVSDWISLTSLL